jgi:hypothetical protein
VNKNETLKYKGVGIYVHSNGDVYQGEFFHKWKSGLGIYWYKESKTYSFGIWEENKVAFNYSTFHNEEIGDDPPNHISEPLTKEEFKANIKEEGIDHLFMNSNHSQHNLSNSLNK